MQMQQMPIVLKVKGESVLTGLKHITSLLHVCSEYTLAAAGLETAELPFDSFGIEPPVRRERWLCAIECQIKQDKLKIRTTNYF